VTAETHTQPPPTVRGLLAILVTITIPILLADQLSKFYIRSHLRLYQDIAVIPNWFDITYTLNPGAAFSLFLHQPPWLRSAFLFTLSATAIVVLIVLLARNPRFTLTQVALAMILAGAAGHL